MLNEPSTVFQEAKKERRIQLVEMYRTAPFEELIAKLEVNCRECTRVTDILARIPKFSETSLEGDQSKEEKEFLSLLDSLSSPTSPASFPLIANIL